MKKFSYLFEFILKMGFTIIWLNQLQIHHSSLVLISVEKIIWVDILPAGVLIKWEKG